MERTQASFDRFRRLPIICMRRSDNHEAFTKLTESIIARNRSKQFFQAAFNPDAMRTCCLGRRACHRNSATSLHQWLRKAGFAPNSRLTVDLNPGHLNTECHIEGHAARAACWERKRCDLP